MEKAQLDALQGKILKGVANGLQEPQIAHLLNRGVATIRKGSACVLSQFRPVDYSGNRSICLPIALALFDGALDITQDIVLPGQPFDFHVRGQGNLIEIQSSEATRSSPWRLPAAKARKIGTVAFSVYEQALLTGASLGLPNRTLGEKLEYSERSIIYHLTNVASRLGVHGRYQLVAQAVGLGAVNQELFQEARESGNFATLIYPPITVAVDRPPYAPIQTPDARELLFQI